MLEFVLENCKLIPSPLECNTVEFYEEVQKRHSFGELITTYTLGKAFFDFLKDSNLATKSTILSQYICLKF
eukprot:UN18681